MKKILNAFSALFFLACFTANTGAGIADEYPNVGLHSQIFTGYSYTRNASRNFNSFNITRAFFGANGDVAKNWSYGVTMDIAPLFDLVNRNIALSDGSSAVIAKTDAASVYLVKAFLAYDLGRHKVSLGMIETVWEEWAGENAWGHERIECSPFEVNGYLTNLDWDLGVSMQGAFFDGMLKYHAGFYNGEGYRWISEASNHKNLQFRLTASPFGEWMSISTGLQWNGISNASDQYVVPIIMTFNLADIFNHAIYYMYMSSEGGNAQMTAYSFNAYLMDRKINPFFRVDYGLSNKTTANGPALGKKDFKLYSGIGYIFNEYVSIDMAFIYLRDASSADPDTYTLGPFAEIKF